jgi:hypothetical protein
LVPKSCRIVLNIHDEVVIQAPIIPKHSNYERIIKVEELKRYAKNSWLDGLGALMVECMTIPIQINDRILKIPVNTKHGYDWNEVS